MSIFTSSGKAKEIYVNYRGAKKEALSAYANLNGQVVKVYSKEDPVVRSNIYYLTMSGQTKSDPNHSGRNSYLLSLLFSDPSSIKQIELCLDGAPDYYQNTTIRGGGFSMNRFSPSQSDIKKTVEFCIGGWRGSTEVKLVRKTISMSSSETSKAYNFVAGDLDALLGVNFSQYSVLYIKFGVEDGVSEGEYSLKGINLGVSLALKITTQENDNRLECYHSFAGEGSKNNGTSRYSWLQTSIKNDSTRLKLYCPSNYGAIIKTDVNGSYPYANKDGKLQAQVNESGSNYYYNKVMDISQSQQSNFPKYNDYEFNKADNTKIWLYSGTQLNSTTDVCGGNIFTYMGITPV